VWLEDGMETPPISRISGECVAAVKLNVVHLDVL
jgi:hypothetical protein